MDRDTKWEVGGGERERERRWRRERERNRCGKGFDNFESINRKQSIRVVEVSLLDIIHNMEINRMIKSGSFVSMG
jgi:hypothetical protein